MSLLHPKRERGLVHHVAPFAFFVFLAAIVVERLDVGCSLWLQSTMTALTATQTYTLDLYNIIYPGSCGRAEQACLYYVHTPLSAMSCVVVTDLRSWELSSTQSPQIPLVLVRVFCADLLNLHRARRY